uniref:Uncharacterized protein n=1 Tax=Cucumis melo TaxID=3656 RepID=A0A9I9EF08_CUCME
MTHQAVLLNHKAPSSVVRVYFTHPSFCWDILSKRIKGSFGLIMFKLFIGTFGWNTTPTSSRIRTAT